MSKWSEIFKLWDKPEAEQYVEIPLQEYQYLKDTSERFERIIDILYGEFVEKSD